MGSAPSSIMSPEAALTAIVVAGAIGLGYTQLGRPGGQTTVPAVGTTQGPGGSGEGSRVGTTKKGKKKSNKAGAGDISDTGSANKSTAPHKVQGIIPGQFDNVSATPLSATPSPPPAKKSKKKKGKAVEQPPPEPASAPLSSSIDYLSESSIKESGKKAKNAKKQQQQQGGQQGKQQHRPMPPMTSDSTVASTSTPQLAKPLQQSITSIDTDGSWTRVGSQRRGVKGIDTSSGGGTTHSAAPTSTTTSDAGITTTSPTADSSPVAGLSTAAELEEDGEEDAASFLLNVNERKRNSDDSTRRTLAEKLLPKPRKTGVDDMLETPDYPTLARVIRVHPLPNEKPVTGFSWADYEDVGENDADGEDDGWGVVRSKRSKRISPSASASQPQVNPNTAQKAHETLTKRQRQNLQKREREKAVKADTEAERLATLAKHKREAEKARMLEQAGKSSGKIPSGGMKATVDERGKLVWE